MPSRNWGAIVETGLAVLTPIVVDLIRAFGQGDRAAADRVSDRLGAKLKSQAKLEAERIRLQILKEGEG